MKISGKVYMHINTHLINETPSGLNPRPELLAGMNDDLPVKVSPYIWGHGLEGVQEDMWAFIDLSVNYAPHEII